jgi:hypothetical protein
MSARTVAILLAAAAVFGLVGWLIYSGQPVEMARCGLKAIHQATAAQPSVVTEAPAIVAESSASDDSTALDASTTGGAVPPPLLPPTVPGGGGSSGEPSRRSVADILESADLSDPTQRARAVAEIAALENERKQAGIARALELGLPLRVEQPDGTVKEVAGLDDQGEVLYFITHNVNAAISTAADVLRTQDDLTGSGLVIGMWDGGAGRATHREFATGRMVIKDGSAPIDHATHVGGTLIASGVSASARGMAVAATVHSYDWNDDKSEMADRGAAVPGEPDKIYLSNHSYGFISGWFRTGGSNPAWIWYGSGSTASSIDPRFGQYNTIARDSDALAAAAPYYLMFRSAGNDRTDSPTNGQMVRLSPSSTTTVAYDSSLHPAGDGVYRNGYDLIGFDAVAKNVITVGSVTDAVANGQRDPSVARQSSFSSWGPTDDGRIKPDLVANGDGLFSSLAGGDSSYGTFSGTSMSAPNAAGTAALLIEEYASLFPGGAMRSSTLKALLIHTADDLGNPGPDYQFGWGLVNGRAAVDLLRDHKTNALAARLTEDHVSSGQSVVTQEFVWDGESPIRATLVWTDPAGTAATSSDLRSPRLRHNLDLRIIGPDGTTFFPYVMPFVGTWTVASMSLPATTGVNNTDNVEMVDIAAPPLPGVYRAVISYQGTLSTTQQDYSLLISGSAAEALPEQPLTIQSVAPASAFSGGTVTLAIDGVSLGKAKAVRLVRSGFPPIGATNVRLGLSGLLADVNLLDAAPGSWSVEVAGDEQVSTLTDGFNVLPAVWSETFDGTVSGWVTRSLSGSAAWVLSTAEAHSPPTSYFIAGPDSKITTRLESPAIAIPANATGLQLKFWHRYNFQNQRDGGRLAISINDGDWFYTDASDSGVSFASNGYNSVIRGTGSPTNRSDFSGERAWTGNSNGFIETILNLNDTAKFAGKSVRFGWVMATDSSTASPGWYVDTILLTGEGDFGNQPPQITSLAVDVTETVHEGAGEEAVTFFVVRAGEVGVNVTATDDGALAELTYTWSATGPAPVFFQPNNENAAASSTSTFEATGDYVLTVSVRDAGGLAATDRINVRVVATAAGLEVDPLAASLPVGGSLTFEALVLDQFGAPMPESSQPASFAWSATGGGQVDGAGRFQADAAGENFSVFASTAGPHGEIQDFATVTVTPLDASVELGDLVQVFDGMPKAVRVITDPPGLSVAVAYDGEENPPSEVGTYAVEVLVTVPNYLGAASATLTIEAPPVTGGYEQWAAEKFAGIDAEDPAADPAADPDGDGVPNLAEFYLGTDPLDPNSRLRITADPPVGGVMRLTIAPVTQSGTFRARVWNDLTEAPTDVPIEEITAQEEAAGSATREIEITSEGGHRLDKIFLRLIYEPPL